MSSPFVERVQENCGKEAFKAERKVSIRGSEMLSSQVVKAITDLTTVRSVAQEIFASGSPGGITPQTEDYMERCLGLQRTVPLLKVQELLSLVGLSPELVINERAQRIPLFLEKKYAFLRPHLRFIKGTPHANIYAFPDATYSSVYPGWDGHFAPNHHFIIVPEKNIENDDVIQHEDGHAAYNHLLGLTGFELDVKQGLLNDLSKRSARWQPEFTPMVRQLMAMQREGLFQEIVLTSLWGGDTIRFGKRNGGNIAPDEDTIAKRLKKRLDYYLKRSNDQFNDTQYLIHTKQDSWEAIDLIGDEKDRYREEMIGVATTVFQLVDEFVAHGGDKQDVLSAGILLGYQNWSIFGDVLGQVLKRRKASL